MSKRVIYSCPFVPAEWIAAHGFEPSRIIPKLTGSGAPNGVCPYAQAFTDAVAADSDAAAIVFTTACDQMRRASETARASAPIFLLNLPHTWQTAGAHKLYREELERLGRFLETIQCSRSRLQSGQENLSSVMLRYEEIRQQILDSRPSLTARQFSEQIAKFHQNPSCFGCTQPKPSPQGSRNIPIALIGGPLTSESFNILDLIEQAGGYVALDGTETGERTLPAQFDRRRITDDPLGALVDAYFGHIPDPFRRPNSEFFKWLKQMIDERGIRGIILRHYLWCDIWRAEAQRISDLCGLPFLELDTGDGALEPTRTKLRLEAFMEVIKQ